MAQRFCPSCKTLVGGFAYCPKCGGQTELLAVLPGQSEDQSYSASGVNTSRQSALWCHLGPLIITTVAVIYTVVALHLLMGIVLGLFAWVPPLVIKSSKKADEFVIAHAKESFNFQVFWIIATYSAIAAWLFIGVPTLEISRVISLLLYVLITVLLAICIVVVQIRGCLAASAGRTYKYPLVLFRLMK